jgi:hypothetical protein
VTAGTDLTGGGTSGNVTLSLNTSATNGLYAQLAAANTFTANQTVNGNIVADASTLGVLGEANATSGGTVGVGGLAASAAGYGVEGLNTAVGGTGVFGTAPQFGVYGIATGSGNTVGVLVPAPTAFRAAARSMVSMPHLPAQPATASKV